MELLIGSWKAFWAAVVYVFDGPQRKKSLLRELGMEDLEVKIAASGDVLEIAPLTIIERSYGSEAPTAYYGEMFPGASRTKPVARPAETAPLDIPWGLLVPPSQPETPGLPQEPLPVAQATEPSRFSGPIDVELADGSAINSSHWSETFFSAAGLALANVPHRRLEPLPDEESSNAPGNTLVRAGSQGDDTPSGGGGEPAASKDHARGQNHGASDGDYDGFSAEISSAKGAGSASAADSGSGGGNLAPVASDQSVTTDEDTVKEITLSGFDPELAPLTYAIVSGPSHGTLSGSGPDRSYTPALNYYGPDSFTFTGNDGQATSSPAIVSIEVAPINDAPEAAIGGSPSTSEEGMPINLSSSILDPDSTAFTYAWSVTKDGVPYATGSDASFSLVPFDNGTFAVALTVTDDTAVSDTVTATIEVGNVAPAVNAGGDLNAKPGEELTFAATVTDPGIADSHTYEWDFGDGTAKVSGTLTPTHTYSVSGDYIVTLTATDDDGGIGTGTLAVKIHPFSVTIDINKTSDEGDDITALVVGKNSLTKRQSVTARVTMHGGSGEVTLIIPPQLKVLGKHRYILTDGESVDITIVPMQKSTTANDAVIVASFYGVEIGREDMTVVEVELPERIAASNTGSGLPARIPPRVKTAVNVGIGPDLAGSGQTVEFQVRGQLSQTGGANIDGNGQMTSSGALQLIGSQQTEPGHAGKLKLVALVRGEVVAESDGFSVAAIPQKVVFKIQPGQDVQRGIDLGNGPGWERQYLFSFESDSGDVRDLDKVTFFEQIVDVQRTGSAKDGFDANVLKRQQKSGPIIGDEADFNLVFGKKTSKTIAQAAMDIQSVIDNGTGTVELNQLFEYTDERTGVTAQRRGKIAESGFHLTYRLFKEGGKYFVSIQRTAQAHNSVQAGGLDPNASGEIRAEVP